MRNPTCRLYIFCSSQEMYLACTKTLMRYHVGYYVCAKGVIRIKSRNADKIRDMETECRLLGAKTERHYDN